MVGHEHGARAARVGQFAEEPIAFRSQPTFRRVPVLPDPARIDVEPHGLDAQARCQARDERGIGVGRGATDSVVYVDADQLRNRTWRVAAVRRGPAVGRRRYQSMEQQDGIDPAGHADEDRARVPSAFAPKGRTRCT